METDFSKQRLDTLLVALVGSQHLVARWWEGPNTAFDLRTPTETYKEDPKKVINYILQQFSY